MKPESWNVLADALRQFSEDGAATLKKMKERPKGDPVWSGFDHAELIGQGEQLFSTVKTVLLMDPLEPK